MTQNPDSTSTTLPTARKPRRTHSQHKRPVLVSSTTQEEQKSQESQIETPESEISHASVHTGSLAEEAMTADTSEVPAKAQRSSRLPKFFSKVEKNVEEAETSQEEVVKARLARAQKTTSNAEATPEVKERKEKDEKPVRAASRTATAARPSLFKTRHFIGMMVYLLVAETLLPLEGSFFQRLGIDHPGHPLAAFTVFNIPMQIMPSVILNIATLVLLLFILVKLDLLPTSMGARTAATARAQQQREQRAAAERPQQPTVRQGVKGEDDDLYQAYRNNQRREKKH